MYILKIWNLIFNEGVGQYFIFYTDCLNSVCVSLYALHIYVGPNGSWLYADLFYFK